MTYVVNGEWLGHVFRNFITCHCELLTSKKEPPPASLSRLPPAAGAAGH